MAAMRCHPLGIGRGAIDNSIASPNTTAPTTTAPSLASPIDRGA
jgi:hypothetical protein